MESRSFDIRDARLSDASAILEIYKPYILETATTFEESVPDVSDFKNRIRKIQESCPFLVCEVDGEIAGYAYSSEYRSRAAYRWNQEVSVYVSPYFQRKNIGKALYSTLIAILTAQGFTKLYGVITLPNIPSIALHESFHFKKFAEYKQVGFKLDQWHTVGWWELSLTEDDKVLPNTPIAYPIFKHQNDLQLFFENGIRLLNF